MPAPTEAYPPRNHVFVDFENVQKIDLSKIGIKSSHFTILLGPRQTKLDTDLVEKLIEHSDSVKMIRLESSGKNALDFVLAYYVGRTTTAYPSTHIHIVSRDTGFEPLIEHLNKQHIRAQRHDSFESLTFSNPATPATAAAKKEATQPDDHSARVLAHLRKNSKNRPKKKTTLLRTIKSQLGKDTTDATAESVFEALRKRGYLSVGENGALTYKL